ncbi:MAG: DUF3160 domain-containing protein [Candidatus Heimdallarchaeota archaeon]|nr:DUF3160 domain-containing protein [Candidatus Heimdallarchaeota archaeon]
MKKSSLISIIASSVLMIIVLSTSLYFVLNPQKDSFTEWIIDYNGTPLVVGSAATTQFENSILSDYGLFEVTQLNYTPSIIPALIKPNLANVDLQGLSISKEINDILSQYGFAIVPTNLEEIYQIYNDPLKPQFITTDLCLHTFHKLFDFCLREIESTSFIDNFQIMLKILRDFQFELNTTITESIVHSSIKKNIAYLSLLLNLLNPLNTVPSQVEEMVNSELTKINSSLVSISAIFNYIEDFSQYKPRGHYTRTEELSRYFQAMMYAGRMGFLLPSSEISTPLSIELTRMAMLLISGFYNSSVYSFTAHDLWTDIYETTSFLVSTSDDLTVNEYLTLWENSGKPSGDLFSNETLILEFIEEAQDLRDPRINSNYLRETFDGEDIPKGFKLMGQRFVPDSYIFQQLVNDKVENRFIPSGLDIISVFGSERAAYHLEDEYGDYPDYGSQIEKLRIEFGNLTEYDWAQSTYWLWLYSFFPLLKPATDGYPGFMRNEYWEDKSLITSLGSWAELKHDTILYTKQSYPVPGIPPEGTLGYVEPNPEFYSRLSSLVHMLTSGFESRNLLNSTWYDKLDRFSYLLDSLVPISIKELQNQPLSDSDFSRISYFGKSLTNLLDFWESWYWMSPADRRMAVIADVYTDHYSTSSVLEVGVGNPMKIYAVVQDENGSLRLTKGGTFSYYEFLQPMTDRLTDEEWINILDTAPPPLPEWIQEMATLCQTTEIETCVVFRKSLYY